MSWRTCWSGALLAALTATAGLGAATVTEADPVFNGARWVWPAELGAVTNTVVEFRRTFSNWDGPKSSAVLTIAADTVYSVELNGKFVHRGRFPDVPPQRYYDEFVVDEVLAGPNELVIRLYVQGIDSFQHLAGDPGVMFRLRGRMFDIVSGTGMEWRRSTADRTDGLPRIDDQLGFALEHDAAAAPGRWQEVGELDCVKGAEAFQLSLRPVPRVEIGSELPARIVAVGGLDGSPVPELPAPGMDQTAMTAVELEQFFESDGQTVRREYFDRGFYVLVDLGREEAGYAVLEVETDAGAVLDLGHAEHMEDGRIVAKVGYRHFANRYRTRAGRQRHVFWQNRIAGRYLQLQVRGVRDRFKLHRLTLEPAMLPVPTMAEPDFAEARHRDIWRTCVRTLKLCMHEHYEDCPWREQALYGNDARIQMLAGYYAFGSGWKFPELSIELLGKGMREDGWLELCMPGKIAITIPSFAFSWVLMIDDHLKHCHDLAFTRRMLPRMKRFLDRRLSELEGGLLPCPAGERYWQFYEWTPGLDGDGRELRAGEVRFDAPLNLWFVLALEAGARVADAAWDPESADAWRIAASKLRTRLREEFYDSGRLEPAELVQALAILAGVVPDADRSRIAEKLAAPSEWTECSLSQLLYKYEALIACGEKYAQKAQAAMVATWGAMLDQGATSFWEVKDGWKAFGNAGSLCHGWSAVPLGIWGAHPELLPVKTPTPDPWAGLDYAAMRRRFLTAAIADRASAWALPSRAVAQADGWDLRLAPDFLFEEFAEAREQFLSPTVPVPTTLTPANAPVAVGCKQHAGEMMVLMVNDGEEPVEVEVTLPTTLAELHLGGERRATPLRNGVLKVRLGAREGRAYWSRAWAISEPDNRFTIAQQREFCDRPWNLAARAQVEASSGRERAKFVNDGFTWASDFAPQFSWAPAADDTEPRVVLRFETPQTVDRAAVCVGRDAWDRPAFSSGWFEANGQRVGEFREVNRDRVEVTFSESVRADALTFHPGPKNSDSTAAGWINEIELTRRIDLAGPELAAEAERLEKLMDAKFFPESAEFAASSLDWDYSLWTDPEPAGRSVFDIPFLEASVVGQRIWENTPMVMGEYLASQICKYRVTQDALALKRARRCFLGLRKVYELSQSVAPGFVCKPYGGVVSDETSSDQAQYMVNGFDLYYPFATADEQAFIREAVVKIADFWMGRDYNYKYYSHPLQWQRNRFFGFLKLAEKYSGEAKYAEERRRILANPQNTVTAPYSSNLEKDMTGRLKPPHPQLLVHSANCECAMTGFLSVNNVMDDPIVGRYVRSLLPQFYQMATEGLYPDGNAYNVLMRDGWGFYEIPRRYSFVNDPARHPKPWNCLRVMTVGPKRYGGHVASAALSALALMAPHDGAAAKWLRDRGGDMLYRIATRHLTHIEDPYCIFPPGARWSTRVRSGDALGFWLWAYWQLRALAF